MESINMEITDDLMPHSRLVTLFCAAGVPMFLAFSASEYLYGSLTMFVVNLLCALTCAINLYVALKVGFSRNLVRASLVGFVIAALYYVSIDWTPSSLMFCLVLPFVTTSVLGRSEGALWNTLIGFISISLVFFAHQLGLESIKGMTADYAGAYVLLCCFAWAYETTKNQTLTRAVAEHEQLIQEIRIKNLAEAKNKRLFEDLTEALHEVRELSGLIPMCACCKRIRGDEDFWENVEAYLHKRTKLTFSHGLCPTCADDALEELDDLAFAANTDR